MKTRTWFLWMGLLIVGLSLACRLTAGDEASPEPAATAKAQPAQGQNDPEPVEPPPAEPESGEGQISELSETQPEQLPADMGLSRAQPFPPSARVKTPLWDFQVLEVLRGEAAWQRILQDDPEAKAPPAGKEYLAVRLRVRCKETDEYSHSFGMHDIYVTGDSNMAHLDRLWDLPAPELVYMDFYTAEELEGWLDASVDLGESNLILVFDQVPWGEDRREYARYLALGEGASLTVSPDILAIPPNDLGVDLAQPAPLQETVVSEDWEITIIEVLRGEEAWTVIQELYPSNAPPEEGMEFILAQTRLRYIGPADWARFIADSNFDALASDGTVYEAPRVNRADPQSPPWMQAGFFPGGEHQGWVPLQVPAGDGGAVMLFAPDKHESGLGDVNVRYLSLEP